jgi:hypothetical protein
LGDLGKIDKIGDLAEAQSKKQLIVGKKLFLSKKQNKILN